MDSRTPDRAGSRAHPLSGLERAALDHIPAMVGYWDRHLRNRLANAAYTDWFGLGAEQLQGIHLSDLLGEEPYAQTLPSVRAVLAGTPQLFRRTMTNAGGETREFQVSYVPDGSAARVPGFFVLVTDITRRALAERRERESADRYRALARSVPGVFVLLFDADLRYIIAEGRSWPRSAAGRSSLKDAPSTRPSTPGSPKSLSRATGRLWAATRERGSEPSGTAPSP